MSDSQTYTITAAVIVAGAAILLQTIVLFAMYLQSRATKSQLDALAARIEPVLGEASRLLTEVRTQAGAVTSRATEVLDLTRRQLERVDEFLEDATARSRAQMQRLELVLDDTVGRFQETVDLLHRGVLQPLRQLNGLNLGIRAALAALFSGRRTTVERATHDEEMFI